MQALIRYLFHVDAYALSKYGHTQTGVPEQTELEPIPSPTLTADLDEKYTRFVKETGLFEITLPQAPESYTSE